MPRSSWVGAHRTYRIIYLNLSLSLNLRYSVHIGPDSVLFLVLTLVLRLCGVVVLKCALVFVLVCILCISVCISIHFVAVLVVAKLLLVFV